MGDKTALDSFFASKKNKKFKPINAILIPGALEKRPETTSAAPAVPTVAPEDTVEDDGWVEIKDEVIQTFNTQGRSVGDLRSEREEEDLEEEDVQAGGNNSRVWTASSSGKANGVGRFAERNFPTLESTVPRDGTAFTMTQKSITQAAPTKNYFNLLEDNTKTNNVNAPEESPTSRAATTKTTEAKAEAPKAEEEDLDKMLEEFKQLDSSDKYAGKKKKKKKTKTADEDGDDA
eukprot:GILK01000511.1.p1 GENE.GILK01000511.1~~GILK01000511.1.p1  ORF type:complete len:265 (-),score=55.97 GILK01000511.1:168-866(-)